MDDQYCISYDFLIATESFRLPDGLEPVSITTHATSDMLSHLENLPKLWDGPISVAVFVDRDSQKFLEYLADLHRCNTEFNQKVTVHFAYRKSLQQSYCREVSIRESNLTCSEFLENKISIKSSFFLYPYSLMRNIARKGAKSKLHFIMDGDMIPSERMALKIKKIANQMITDSNKNVLLVRRFESVKGTVIPRNSNNLEISMMENKTQEFHINFYFNGHQIKNLPYWFEKSRNGLEISSWPIEFASPNWEPQPIVHRNALYGSDYIPSRIKDVMSMTYKLCRANYNFHVLSHVFSVQEGVKTKDTVFSQAVAYHQQIYEKERAFKRYRRELEKFPAETLKKCGKFEL